MYPPDFMFAHFDETVPDRASGTSGTAFLRLELGAYLLTTVSMRENGVEHKFVAFDILENNTVVRFAHEVVMVVAGLLEGEAALGKRRVFGGVAHVIVIVEEENVHNVVRGGSELVNLGFELCRVVRLGGVLHAAVLPRKR